jgi:hypothetical protein
MLRRYYNFWLSADEVFVNDTLQNVSVAGMMQVACSISRIGRSGHCLCGKMSEAGMCTKWECAISVSDLSGNVP